MRPDDAPATYQDLLEKYQSLQKELEISEKRQAFIWDILVRTSRRMQASSASIKAAVSSLLNKEIFWDPANQYEFAQTIDSSAGHLSKLVLLLNLTFRAQSGSLSLNFGLHPIHEVISSLDIGAEHADRSAKVQYATPPAGKPILVDFEYLKIALSYLFEVILAKQAHKPVTILLSETPADWQMDINGVNASLLDVLQALENARPDLVSSSNLGLLPEYVLALQVCWQIFNLQEITLEIFDKKGIRIHFPIKL